MGLGADEAREGKFLGRLVRYTVGGLEWEADPKQVAALIAEFGLESGNCVDTPGVKSDMAEGVTPMSKGEASRFRRGAANINYLS